MQRSPARGDQTHVGVEQNAHRFSSCEVIFVLACILHLTLRKEARLLVV